MFNTATPVNPDMLVLARELRGYTREYACERSGIPLFTLTAYETVGGVLPRKDLFALAEGYGFPIAFFQQEGKFERDNIFTCRSTYGDFDER